MARLRTADQEHWEDILWVVIKVVGSIRQKLPQVGIVLQADCHFGRDELTNWCEGQPGVFYVLGILGLCGSSGFLALLPVKQITLRIPNASAASMASPVAFVNLSQ